MNRNTCLVRCKGITHRVVLAMASVLALHPLVFAGGRWQVIELANVSSGGAQDNGVPAFLSTLSLSVDGRFMAFSSSGSSLVSGNTNSVNDVFVRDRQADL